MKAIAIDITHNRRYKKQAYITIMLRNPHTGAAIYKESKRVFITLIVVVDRKQILIWNRQDNEKALGGWHIDRATLLEEEIPPLFSWMSKEEFEATIEA